MVVPEPGTRRNDYIGGHMGYRAKRSPVAAVIVGVFAKSSRTLSANASTTDTPDGR
jgi:hypothetical protein